jgi:hypothetical protein
MPTLFDICEDMQALDQLLIEADGDVSDPVVSDYIDRLFSDLDSQLQSKVENYCRLIVEVQARSEARRRESERILARAKVDKRMADGLKERLQNALDFLRIKKVETARFRVSVAINGGMAPLVVHDHLVPESLMKMEAKPDKNRIRELLESGAELDCAKLDDRGRHLSIR